MILNGLTITIVGMSIVFAFLIILVFSMIFLHALLRRFMPRSLATGGDGEPKVSRTPETSLGTVAAAISAARTHILRNYRGRGA